MKYFGMGELFILHNCMLVARHGDTNTFCWLNYLSTLFTQMVHRLLGKF